jgi:hypothetical protein
LVDIEQCRRIAVHTSNPTARLLREAVDELEQLRAIVEAIQPGTMEAFIEGMFQVAQKYGHPQTSAEHGLSFLDQEIARLRAAHAELTEAAQKALMAFRTENWFDTNELRAVLAKQERPKQEGGK